MCSRCPDRRDLAASREPVGWAAKPNGNLMHPLAVSLGFESVGWAAKPNGKLMHPLAVPLGFESVGWAAKPNGKLMRPLAVSLGFLRRPNLRRTNRHIDERRSAITPLLLAASLALLLSGCYREQRPLPASPPGATPPAPLRMTDLQPGEPLPGAPTNNPLEENAFATSQGKRLFKQFNCNGCHGGAGGGDSGPPLMDDKWIYGHEPANIYASIVQGRPNGMPSFGGHIPDEQVWQLVAYIRSMSGQLRSDVAPSRSDSLSPGKPEQRHEKETPKPVSQPASDR